MQHAKFASLDPAAYARHALHHPDRAWPETNCYVDLWIELLNALRLEPRAALPFTVGIDFEGDQWTFFKFPLADLSALYGIDVQELAIWRPLHLQAVEQLSRGHVPIVEMDSFYLPDTQGTAYRHDHVKTSIAIAGVDVDAKRLNYFHNAGYYALSGEDFDGVFRLLPELSGNPNILPPYVELVKFGAQPTPSGADLAKASLALLKTHFEKAPRENPVTLYRPRFAQDLEWLKGESMPSFHLYAFATLRQLGANFELCSSHLRWLSEAGLGDFEPAAVAFDTVSSTSKALLFKLARAVNTKKFGDYAPMVDALEAAWAGGMAQLGARLSR